MTTFVTITVALLAGGGFTALLNYAGNRKLLQKQAQQTEAQTDNIAVTTLKEALTTINEDVIKPLNEENKVIKTELKKLTNELIKFRKAIEKIPSCAYAHQCPATRVLQNRTGGGAGAGDIGDGDYRYDGGSCIAD